MDKKAIRDLMQRAGFTWIQRESQYNLERIQRIVEIVRTEAEAKPKIRPLTDEEIKTMIRSDGMDYWHKKITLIDFARAIEVAHGIK